MMKLYMSKSDYSYKNGKSDSNSEIFNYNNGKAYYKKYKNNKLIKSDTYNKEQLMELMGLKNNNDRYSIYRLDQKSNRYKQYNLYKPKNRYRHYLLKGGSNIQNFGNNLHNFNDIEPGVDLNNTKFSKNIIRLTPK